MKGYYIEITNNLLDLKHRKAMKESVWLFMWLLDKMTSISEDGIGKVLGGKPIKYEEVNKELAISRPTYIRWIELLEKGFYINTIRAPNGLVITVNKAKKRFGRDVSKMTHHKRDRDVSNSDSDVSKMDSDVSNSDIQYKTINKDINKDNTKEATPPVVADNINPLIEKFKPINPSYERLFGDKTQRAAIERMLKKFGQEKLEKIIDSLSVIFGQPYSPTITTPYLLERKMGDLIAYFKKRSQEKINFIDFTKL